MTQTWLKRGFIFLFLANFAHGKSPCEEALTPPDQLGFEFSYADPFTQPSGLTLNAIRYDQITPGILDSALQRELYEARKKIAAIRDNPDAPTFANTVEALEFSEGDLARVYYVFSNFLNTKRSDKLIAIANRVEPQIAALQNSMILDSKIFARVAAVYDQRDALTLAAEQKKLLEKWYRNFVRNGVRLPSEQKARINEIDTTLAEIGEKFSDNVSKAEAAFSLLVTDFHRLDGLSQDLKDSARKLAQSHGHQDTWELNLDESKLMLVLQFAKDRKLREELWRGLARVATSAPYDNRPVLLEIAKLRQERANILGYSSHADYKTELSMAKDMPTIEAFLKRMYQIYKPYAEKDIQNLAELAGHPIEPWDVHFYSEKLRRANYGYDNDEVRAYFPLDQVLKGAFFAVHKYYGVTFVSRPDLPVWDQSVRAYEVRNKLDQIIGLYYFDPFAHPGEKRGGAWNMSLQGGGLDGNKFLRPHVVNVANFSVPEGDKPSLLTWDQTRIVFHELGHALHTLLSTDHYPSFFGTSVAIDGVELPSQFNEQMRQDPEVLAMFARHYLTGEQIPADLLAKILRAESFMKGYYTFRGVMSAELDMAWHSVDLNLVKTPEDVEAWENAAVVNFTLFDRNNAHNSAAFDHIFDSGYSAGYYSYAWSDVLVADAIEFARSDEPTAQRNIFDLARIQSFQTNILEQGGSEEMQILYRRFRGGDPDPDALLRVQGLKQ